MNGNLDLFLSCSTDLRIRTQRRMNSWIWITIFFAAQDHGNPDTFLIFISVFLWVLWVYIIMLFLYPRMKSHGMPAVVPHGSTVKALISTSYNQSHLWTHRSLLLISQKIRLSRQLGEQSFLFLVPFSLLPAFNHLLGECGESKEGKGRVFSILFSVVVIFFISELSMED